ncbi:MAG: disulfide oxidoreductase [Acidimicrobiales bacterium]|jgi:disulfide bond formation protein DsbB|nr:disulfide oxidoreductase [Acidimicrobiales bacterium]
MNVDAMSTFFALLSLVALAGAAATGVLAVVRRRDPDGPLAGWWHDLGRVSLLLAWLVALTATLGSLYYSESANFVPCQLCWYQRICMYPLALLLGLAAWRRDRAFAVYGIALAAVGAALSIYHSWLQAFPPDSGSSFCTADAPCTTRHVWEFGFVSIPFMALSGFLFILAMMGVARSTVRHEETT